jgi:hypothetical protein
MMKIFLLLFVIALGAALWRFKLTPVNAVLPSLAPSEPASPAAFTGLRNQAFRMTRTALGLPPALVATEPFGVLMETGYDMGAATVVAFGDGSASIYLSTGGGYIGGASLQALRTAARALVTEATQFQPQATPTTTFPLPKPGETRFYLLSDAGVFTASAAEQELGEHRHPWSPLFYAGQAIVTQYRLLKPQP